MTSTSKFLGLRNPLFAVLFLVGACPAIMDAQVLRGRILDSETLRPIESALVSVNAGESSTETITDGSYRFDSLAPGHYTLQVQHIRYSPESREVLLSTGKESVVDILLVARSYTLEEVTVQASVMNLPDRMFQITEEEVRRYPGTFFDPARFAQAFPGVQIVNDQANQLVINGMSPDLMQWRMEGLEVVNPNHLANAGTVFDQPTQTGGGVNMLSNLVLANSRLVQASHYGINNATSGVMDIHFRNGNTENYEHTVQAGLLGLEASTEGPFREGSNSSYLVNFRYSTVGLLSLMGVDFGDEAIQFGDLSVQANVDLGPRAGTLKFFGVAGRNSNTFEEKPPEDHEIEKDLKNIRYRSGQDVIGVTWQNPIGENALLTAKTAFSRRDYSRDEDSDILVPAYTRNTEGSQNKWSSRIALVKTFATRNSFEVAFTSLRENNRYEASFRTDSISVDTDLGGTNTLLRPSAHFRSAIGTRITTRFGLGIAWYDNSRSTNLEPEVEVTWQINDGNALTGRYRRSSQAVNTLYFTTDKANRGLDPIRGHNVSIVYRNTSRIGAFEFSAAYSLLQDVPVTAEPSDFSILNLAGRPAGTGTGRLTNRGEGEMLSVSAGYRKDFSRSYFITANASVIQSEYEGSDGITRSTTFDVGYSAYIAGGKEWVKEKQNGARTWGINAGYIQNGGMRYPTIDEDLSSDLGVTIYEDGTAGANQLGDYIRLDMRIYFTRDKENRSYTISLDIQNVIGNANDWFPVYDSFLGTIRQQEQLGFIPVLNWRLDF